MTVPGVGPVVALTYRATVDVPARFRNSKAVGAVFGLTPSKHQSGESDRTGAISRCGDEMMRAMLYEAAHIMLVRSTKWSWLKAWAAMPRMVPMGDRQASVSPTGTLCEARTAGHSEVNTGFFPTLSLTIPVGSGCKCKELGSASIK